MKCLVFDLDLESVIKLWTELNISGKHQHWQWTSPVEDVLLCALSQSGWSVSEAPQEANVGPHVDPTTHCRHLVLQDRRLVHQTVELHCSLDHQRERIGGEGGPAAWHDCNYIIPAVKRKGEVQLLLLTCLFFSNINNVNIKDFKVFWIWGSITKTLHTQHFVYMP